MNWVQLVPPWFPRPGSPGFPSSPFKFAKSANATFAKDSFARAEFAKAASAKANFTNTTYV